ncbi:hypothetical protein ZWY2020_046937 [Hordeum vulgare]|nr:hypothetical protein ZWY2020_046937 [Hordeum vulgare]
MDQCPAPRLLGPMGSISINDETSAVAGLGGTGLAASAHRTRLAARIATRTATTRNKSRRRRASMASQEEGRKASWMDGWISYAEDFYNLELSNNTNSRFLRSSPPPQNYAHFGQHRFHPHNFIFSGGFLGDVEQNGYQLGTPSWRLENFGLIFGRSGSGKTTLLQLLSCLSEPTSGSICIQKYDDNGKPMGLSEVLASQRVGIVFQFPERYFLSDTILEEVTFGWPRQKADISLREQLGLKLQNAINSVGLSAISLDKDPQSLSGGFKRRLALAIQLVQTPDLLLLDEPLAGLDWKARADVVNLLKDLKKDHTILVVSHDLRELYPLVDRSWRMEMGGVLKEEPLPV